MFEESSKLDINIQIRTVLTKMNYSTQMLERLLTYLSQYSCIKKIDFTPAFFPSTLKTRYIDLAPDVEGLMVAYDYLATQSIIDVPMTFNKIDRDGYVLKRYQKVEDFIKGNMICTANFSTISILASGKVTVCEMCYEAEDFLLGDLRH